MLVITIVWWGFDNLNQLITRGPTLNVKTTVIAPNQLIPVVNPMPLPAGYGKHTTHKIVILEMVCDWFYHFSTKLPYENCRLRA